MGWTSCFLEIPETSLADVHDMRFRVDGKLDSFRPIAQC